MAELGTAELAGDAYFVATSPADGQGTTLTLTRASAPSYMEPASAAASTLTAEKVSAPGYTEPTATASGTLLMVPVSLDPDNLYVYYDDADSEFKTEWFKKGGWIEEQGELIIVGDFRLENNEPIDIIVERDNDDDGVADMHTGTVTLNNDEHVLHIDEDEYGREIAERGYRYRLRFPGYAQQDALSRIHLALGWENFEEFRWESSIEPIEYYDEPQRAVAETIVSENYRIDATLDEIYESQHIETANDRSLERLANEVNISRRSGENDPHLRKRALAASATRTFSSAADDVTDLVELVFEDDTNEIGLDTLPDEPVLVLDVPSAVLDNHMFDSTEIEEIFDDAVASSYDAHVNVV